MVTIAEAAQKIEERIESGDMPSDERILSGLGTAKFFNSDAAAALNLINQEFNGDPSAALEFIGEHGNDPAIANQDFGDFARNGASSYIAQLRLQKEAVEVKVGDDLTQVVVEQTVTDDKPEVSAQVLAAKDASVDTLAKAQQETATTNRDMVANGFDPKSGVSNFLSLVASRIDVNGDGFIGGTRDQLHAEMDDRLLAKYDFNGDGVVGLGILQGILHRFADRAFDKVDLNGDNQIGSGFMDAIIERAFGDGSSVSTGNAKLAEAVGIKTEDRLGIDSERTFAQNTPSPTTAADFTPNGLS